ncbi:DUF6522 family protein [Cognatiyoonia sp. IB215182]|uniref:DUF6522 family protein n=1 Tax=Cognatiyoonia sp. IB215182 TaxID=3097353 RepID=UPI002A0B7357|nr:DUF6522 family protein [Cognatiyoonia sp. IB215182]MDX8355718.1 DUF6522 family protein [Cognatiyoonia sp. IB215182]
MSDIKASRRIRAQSSSVDEHLMGFVLDEPLETLAATATSTLDPDAPLVRAILGLPGVDRVELSSATIWVRKIETADWSILRPAIAATIREVLDTSEKPLGENSTELKGGPDSTLLDAVKELLERQVNPSIASHGGHIAVERVENGTVFVRMSGGCQGCAASSATLRQGVERMLRAALPTIRDIVDVTDHENGQTPFYKREPGMSAILDRAVPPGVVEWQNGKIVVDSDFLAPRLGLTPEALRQGLHSGDVVGVTETGVGEDEGSARIVLRSSTRAWAAVLRADGTAHEVPPPRQSAEASEQEQALAAQVRSYLERRPADAKPITYGALTRALGLWAPGSVRKVTRALEMTMLEDAQSGRPFIAARVISRGNDGLPGKGFFDLARGLSRGPEPNESDAAFHTRELSQSDKQPEIPHSIGAG